MRSTVIGAFCIVFALGSTTFLGTLSSKESHRSGPPRDAVQHRTAPAVREPSPDAVRSEDNTTTTSAAIVDLEQEAERLEAMARYPQWSQPLDLIGDPIAAAEFDVPSARSAGDDDLVLTIAAERATFAAPDPIIVRARLSKAGFGVPAQVTGKLFDGLSGPVMEVHFTPGAGVRAVSDAAREYHASFIPPLHARSSAGYTLRVDAQTAEGARRSATLEFVYHRPATKLTGRFADRVENGDLVIDVEVAGDASANVRLEGSLYDSDGVRQVAWAVSTAGARGAWLPLRFHGLILRDQQVSGPYLLKFVSLTEQTNDAEARGQPLENAYLTRAYDASAFDGDAANDAELLNEAAVLRERVARLQHEPAE